MVVLMASPCDAEAQRRNPAAQDASTSSASFEIENYVLRVGNELVTLDDFTHVYGKNNRDSVYTIDALDEYMELFVNFKLKVIEAESLGMDTVPAFVKELADTARNWPDPISSMVHFWTSSLRKPLLVKAKK